MKSLLMHIAQLQETHIIYTLRANRPHVVWVRPILISVSSIRISQMVASFKEYLHATSSSHIVIKGTGMHGS